MNKNSQFLAIVRDLVGDIKKMSHAYPKESRYIFETLTQREAITPDEIKLAIKGQVEGDRAPVIIRTLMLVKNALFELQGQRIHDPVPCKMMPKRAPIVNSNNPHYNLKYGYKKKKLRESKQDAVEKAKAKQIAGYWRY